MTIQTIHSTPFDDQRPGTSGLRKKVRVFEQPHYLANFVQAVFDAIDGIAGKTLVLGGDGRFFNDTAIQIIARMIFFEQPTMKTCRRFRANTGPRPGF